MIKDVTSPRDEVDAWVAAVDVWRRSGMDGPPPRTPWEALTMDARRPHAQSVAMLAEVTGLARARDAALCALEDMVAQHCDRHGDENGHVGGMGLTANANAIVLLAEAGRIEIDGNEGNRGVHGRWKR